jgi:hypothetical protein
MTLSRLASLAVAAAYLVVAFALRGSNPQVVVACGLIVLLSTACIWFPEALGSYIGSPEVGSVQRSTPGVALATAGWVVLTVVPAVILVMTG